MASVKIGNKNIALPPGMSEKELEKAIRKLEADFIKDSFKPPKPVTAKAKKDGGMMKKNLKPVNKEKNPGLAKLPTEVRNKMGFMKDGGEVTVEEAMKQAKKESGATKQLLTTDPNDMPPSQRKIAEKLKNFIKKNKRTPSTDAEVDSVYGKGATEKSFDRFYRMEGKPFVKSPAGTPAPVGTKFMKKGGMVLEIGLRPATAKENKMAKEMMGKKPKKMAGGGMVSRGTGAAIRGTKFKGVF